MIKALKKQIPKVFYFYGKIKKYLGYAIIVITGLLFYFYIKSSPEISNSLKSISLILIPVVILFYTIVLFTNVVITIVTIRLCNKTYSLKDSLQLTMYSTLINFFGPLQSGPGFRAIYLKKKINLGIKEYTKATIVYYLFFTLISSVILFGWKYPLLTIFGIFLFLLALKVIFEKMFERINIRLLLIIFIATLIQIGSTILLYSSELRSLGYDFNLQQVLAYTGAANLALFVALTPAAIGIRESFLLLSSSIHHVPTAAIVSAGLVDRAIYFIFLVILFLATSLWHIQSKFSSTDQ